jgi:hypothetical protein
MGSWFQDAILWPQLLLSSDGRDQLKNDIKYGQGTAAVGNPLHGLTAGYKIHELMSPTVHINDRIQDIRKNGLSSDHLKWAIEDQNHNLQDAFKENIPALGMFLAGGAGGAFGGGSGGSVAGAGSAAGAGAEGAGLISASDAAALSAAEASAASAGTGGVSASSGMGMAAPSSGFDWGMVQSGLSLLGQAGGSGQQQQPVATSSPPDKSVTQESTRRRMQVAVRLQQLRAKPNKTAAERAEMKELAKNPMGLV